MTRWFFIFALLIPQAARAAGGDACDQDWQCARSERCGVQNAHHFGDREGSACWPASCQDLAYQCGHCGTMSDRCGLCPALEICDPDARVAKVRVWNLVANDGSGDSTGNDPTTTQRQVDPLYFQYLSMDDHLATCGVGNSWQLSFESVQYATVPPHCLVGECRSLLESTLASSSEFLNIVRLNQLGGGSGAAIHPNGTYVMMAGPSQTPFNLTAAHEVGHVLQVGWNNPELNDGDHYPAAPLSDVPHPRCTSTDSWQRNLMCEVNRGLIFHRDQCDYFYAQTILPWFIRQGATHGALVIEQIVDRGAQPGHYTFEISNPSSGWITLRKDGAVQRAYPFDPNLIVSASRAARIHFPGYFDVWVRAFNAPAPLATLSSTVFDNAKILRIESSAGEIIRPGRQYGEYFVKDVVLDGAPEGEYTLRDFVSIFAGMHQAQLYRDGRPVANFLYDPRHRLEDETSTFRLQFPGYFDIELRSARGELTLQTLDRSVLDGQRVLRF